MASSPTLPLPPSISEDELEEVLTDVGNKLLKPPSSTEELLKLLDELGFLLSKVGQEPTLSMLDALLPSMKALMGTEILMHNDTDVKVWVASCISEIARIMAPNAPYSDDEMKKYFQLSIVAVEQLSNRNGHSYSRAVSVLRTLANIRLCVLMLDLELDDLILKMFERFLDIKSQPDALLSDMERIMTLIVEESEERSFELLSVLLKSVKRENQYVSPLSWELGQKVLKNCAGVLISDIPKAVNTMGTPLNDFAEIVASICQMTPKTDNVDTQRLASDDISMRRNDEKADEPRSGIISGGPDTLVHETALMDCQQISVTPLSHSQPKDMSKEAVTQQSQRKRGRKPNSLKKEEEGYDNSWVIGISSSQKTPCRGKFAKKRSNPSNSSALAGSICPPESGKEPKSLTFSVKNVQGVTLASAPSGMQQKEKSNSSMNPDNGLSLLSVSAGDLVNTENEGTPATLAPKTRGRRKTGLVNTSSQGDAKPKRKRGPRKKEIDISGDATPKHREGIIPTMTDGISSSREIKSEFPVLQLDAGVPKVSSSTPKVGSSAPIGHASDKTGDEFAYDGASKDHGEVLVGRKIKVWWPADDQFYRGVVTGFDPEQKKHKVEYVDGDHENLFLSTERWEIVEDEEDSEATEDTRPTIISSANRVPGGSGGSSHPGNLTGKASVSHRKKRMSSSSEPCRLVENKLQPDGAASARRTKRRTLPDDQRKNSSALSDQVFVASSIPVDVGGYRVKAANAPILTSILAKYGDIAAQCMFTSAAVRASMLEVICDIVKRLQSNNAAENILHLEAMETEVRDAEAAKIEVSWLQLCLAKFREANVGKSPSVLKQMHSSLKLVSKAAERDLTAAQKWAKEAESCVRALAVVGKRFSDDMSIHEAKESEWRNPLDELAKP